METAVETVGCSGLTDSQSCKGSITSYGSPSDQSRSLSERLLEATFIEYEIIIVTICAFSDCSDAKAVADALYTLVTTDLEIAYGNGDLVAALRNNTSDSSLITLLASAIVSGNFGVVTIIIEGLGMYYPAWGVAATCLNDRKQELYMTLNPTEWMYQSLQECCHRYYSWDEIGCVQKNAEITGSSQSIPDPTAVLYYPEWLSSDVCVNDGLAPSYMKKQPVFWMRGEQ